MAKIIRLAPGVESMGQYYYVVNPDKKQYLHPHKFGCGLKLGEFSSAPFGPMNALAILLAVGNGRGGGDLQIKNADADAVLVGSWAGDRVFVAGDYAGDCGIKPSDPSKFDSDDTPSLYAIAREEYEDISDRIISVVAKAEAAYGHPWAVLDLAVDGWRDVPDCVYDAPRGVPEKPAGGQEAFAEYMRLATHQSETLTARLLRSVRASSSRKEALSNVDKAIAAMSAARSAIATGADWERNQLPKPAETGD